MPLSKQELDKEKVLIILKLLQLRQRNEEKEQQRAEPIQSTSSQPEEPDAETKKGVAEIISQLLRLRIAGEDGQVDEEEEREDLHNSAEMHSLLGAFGLPRPEPSQKRTKRGRGEEQKNKKKSPDLGLTATGKPRWTRKDIPRLPKAILKISTPEELDDIFDDDGYLEPLTQSLVESQLTEPPLCFVCRKPASAKCSECKMVRYCSQECQRSHWKTHKPTCLLIRDPLHFSVDYASEEIQRNPEFAKQMAVGVNMRQHGRRYDTVEELIETWAKTCTVGGNFSFVTHLGTRMFVVLREPETGVLQIHGETTAKPLKTHRMVKSGRDPTFCKDVVKYIVDYIQTTIRNIWPPVLSVYAEFTTVPLHEVDFTQVTHVQTRRAAEITLRDGHCGVIQFEPDSLRESDEIADPGKVTHFLYVW